MTVIGTVAVSSAMAIRRTVIETMRDDHRMLAWIVSIERVRRATRSSRSRKSIGRKRQKAFATFKKNERSSLLEPNLPLKRRPPSDHRRSRVQVSRLLVA